MVRIRLLAKFLNRTYLYSVNCIDKTKIKIEAGNGHRKKTIGIVAVVVAQLAER